MVAWLRLPVPMLTPPIRRCGATTLTLALLAPVVLACWQAMVALAARPILQHLVLALMAPGTCLRPITVTLATTPSRHQCLLLIPMDSRLLPAYRNQPR